MTLTPKPHGGWSVFFLKHCACTRGCGGSRPVDSRRPGSSAVDSLSVMALWFDCLPSFHFSCSPPPTSPLSQSQLPLLSDLRPQPKAKVGRLLPEQRNSPAAPDCWPQEPRVTMTIIICSPLAPRRSVHGEKRWTSLSDALLNGWMDGRMDIWIERTKDGRVSHWMGEH